MFSDFFPYTESKKSSPEKRKKTKNLVLDLDETLVRSEFDDWKLLAHMVLNNDQEMMKSVYTGVVSGDRLWGRKRNFVDDFLDFAHSEFNVIYWTAGTEDYANFIVGMLTRGKHKPYKVLSRKDCDRSGGQTKKPLYKIYDENIRPENTLVVDDRHDYMEPNPDNAIIIPPYNPSTLEEMYQFDTALVMLKRWLSGVKYVRDVRLLDKSKIFGG